MKKILKTLWILVMIVSFTGEAYSQESPKKTTKVDKEVEVVNGKKMVTFTVTEIEAGKVTVKDTTFDGTNGYDEQAILKALGIDKPTGRDSMVMEKILIEEIGEGPPTKKIIIKTDDQMDVDVEEIDGKNVIRTIKRGDTMVNIIEIADKKILFNEQEIELGDSMHDMDIKVLKWINEDGDTNHMVQKEIIIVFKADVRDLNEDELKKLMSDDIITKRAKPMNEVDVDVYPNPTSGKLTISFSLEDKGDTDVKLINSTGAIIYNENLSDFTGEYSKGIDIAANSKGVYYLVVQQGKQVLTKKIVLQ